MIGPLAPSIVNKTGLSCVNLSIVTWGQSGMQVITYLNKTFVSSRIVKMSRPLHTLAVLTS